MQKIVLDSDIIIDFLRTGKGLFPQIVKLQAEGKIEMYVSCITVFELFSGSSSKRDEFKILELTGQLNKVPFDEHLAKFAGEIRRDRKPSIALADYLIAATALFLDANLATRNKNHYKEVKGLRFFEVSATSASN